MKWKTIRLGDVADFTRDCLTPQVIPSGTQYVGLEHLDSEGAFSGVDAVDAGHLGSMKFRFDAGHILYGRLRPYLRKIARPDFAGVCSTEVLPLRPREGVSRDYLFHFLRQPHLVEQATSRCKGANLPRVSAETLADFEVPLPPLAEQRRLAAILDAADGVRRQRAEGVRLTGELLRAAFLELCGDPATNPKGWGVVKLSDIVLTGLRNGVSPASAGTVEGKVLILSAITGADFDAGRVKTGVFRSGPDAQALVTPDVFLMCRGNGNLSLVGCGRFPTKVMPGTVFPDTMIGADTDFNRVSRPYLEAVWSTPHVRLQLEAGARTTNGTHKVNQQVLSTIEFPLPPIREQERYSRIASHLAVGVRERGVSESAALFDALVHRAFRGEL